MFSHVTVGCRDMARACMFYDAVLSELGFSRRIVVADGGPQAACWVVPGQQIPRFYVYMPFNGLLATGGNGSMVAFSASSVEAVNYAYAAGMRNGGTCEGVPNPRPRYGDGYYGGYLRDPDANKLHLVFRGDLIRADAT
ncbi:MAG: VOC family protein [Pseudomonadota bacterium]